jgi:hypothetical protein
MFESYFRYTLGLQDIITFKWVNVVEGRNLEPEFVRIVSGIEVSVL